MSDIRGRMCIKPWGGRRRLFGNLSRDDLCRGVEVIG